MSRQYKKINFQTDGYMKIIADTSKNELVFTSLGTNPLVVPLASISPGTMDYNKLSNIPWVRETDPFGTDIIALDKTYDTVGFTNSLLDSIKGIYINTGDSQDCGLYFNDSYDGIMCKPEGQGVKLRGLQQLYNAGSPILADNIPQGATNVYCNYVNDGTTQSIQGTQILDFSTLPLGTGTYTPIVERQQDGSIKVSGITYNT